jgi:hypothetical protein
MTSFVVIGIGFADDILLFLEKFDAFGTETDDINGESNENVWNVAD